MEGLYEIVCKVLAGGKRPRKALLYITSINMLLVVMEKVLMKVLKDRWELDGEHEGRGCRREDSDGGSQCTLKSDGPDFKSQAYYSLTL